MITKRATALAAALSAALTIPTPALANQGISEAENIRRLDMMLMATSLRCRTTAHDFRAKYRTFSRFNMHHIKSANDRMRRNLTATYGKRGGERELDRRSVRMANRYGNGHPHMDCRALKEVAGDLARAHSQASLADAALGLLGGPRIAFEVP